MTESFLQIFSASFVMILLAEMGDKSQLVCISLASRFNPRIIITAALTAFALLNLIAVTLGSVIADWIPQHWLALVVALMFLVFGLQAIRTTEEEEDETPGLKGKQLFTSVLLLIFLAEFGDKTQLAVAGLGTQYTPTTVWIGATLALWITTLLGVYLGNKLLTKLPLHRIHQFSGALFLIFAALSGWEAITGFQNTF